ncbi:hypothetical protein [Desulfotruncus arcticus]|uniref:hypothetical protein n=1 Tax=Desulfotruncus arcticus TaxID=341036 RepID=UPI0013F4E477|nr:hypothetical protein [Desulfotruncus arcticus]
MKKGTAIAAAVVEGNRTAGVWCETRQGLVCELVLGVMGGCWSGYGIKKLCFNMSKYI